MAASPLIMVPHNVRATITLDKDKILRVLGPARIHVEDGCIRLLGIVLCKGQEIWISRYRSYGIKAIDVANLSIFIGEGGGIEEPLPGEEPIDVWEAIGKEIVDRGGRVVVLGPVESGKTSFATLLSNLGIEHGLKSAIIDADIGQCDLAPPGFIAMKIMDRKVLWLREVTGDVKRFIGFITPSPGIAIARIMASIVELINIAEERGANLIIVNTDGWFGDLASIQFKIQLIKSVKPASIAIMGGNSFCKPFADTFSKFSATKVYCIPSPAVVKSRSRDDRRQLRKVNYAQYLRNAKKRCFNINDIAVLDSCLFNGPPYQEGIEALKSRLGIDIVMASKYEDVLVLALQSDTKIDSLQLGHENIYVIKPSFARGALVALLNEKMEEVGMGVIDSVDLVKKEFCILTEYDGDVRGVVIGRIMLNEEFADKGKIVKCVI
ncbi:MAG: Clp1/GlmU family protein [Ignisphaera sp.]